MACVSLSFVIVIYPHGCILTLAVPDVIIRIWLEYPLSSAKGASAFTIYKIVLEFF